jgi:phosphatidylserine/phosphatidylglycerophosphate/cardiolipin synthase-like enzyme
MSRRRSSKPQQGLIVAFVTLIVIICGLFYSLTGIDPGGMFGGSPTPPNTIPVFPTNTPFQPIPSGNTWWQVYFTDPLTVNDSNNYGNSIEQRLIERINAAQISIHIASFEFDLTPVADALIAAHNRGVDVRWVTDDEYGLGVDEDPGHGQFQALKDAGIEVRSDNRTALMHNKFWICGPVRPT